MPVVGAPTPAAPAPAADANGESRDLQSFMSPVVARMVAEHGLDIAQIPGTGRGGRVTKRDVEVFLGGGAAPAAAAPAAGRPGGRARACRACRAGRAGADRIHAVGTERARRR